MLEVSSLSKSFRLPRRLPGRASPPGGPARAGLLHAVRSVSFRAEPGKILGVLGPNGAGKTTLLRLLATALEPSSGGARFDDIDIVRHPRRLRRRLGFLSGTTGLYGRLTARELVAYHGRLHGMSDRALEARIDALFTELGIQGFSDRRCEQLSTGMKQKVSIARTLVHDPDLVVLDEPTTGLDVAAARTIVELVQRLRGQGKTVLLSTHHMHEVDRLCDRVVVMKEGRLCFDGTVSRLRERTGQAELDLALLALLDAEEVDHAA